MMLCIILRFREDSSALISFCFPSELLLQKRTAICTIPTSISSSSFSDNPNSLVDLKKKKLIMIRWLNQMISNFGVPFLWLVSLVYFTQGFRSFVWTAVSYQLKDVLKLTPSASQIVVSTSHMPWSIKPLYGVLSDCFPIRGKKRIPYLVISTILSLLPWLTLGILSPLRSTTTSLIIFLTMQNVGSAMADVVIDAMIAEAARSERAAYAGDLQLLSWSAMALGGVAGSLLGGYSLSNLSISAIFIIFSTLPALQLFSCKLVKEVPTNNESLVTAAVGTLERKSRAEHPAVNDLSRESTMKDDNNVNVENKLLPVPDVVVGDSPKRLGNTDQDIAVPEKQHAGHLRQRKRTDNAESKPISLNSDASESQKPVYMRWFGSLRAGFYTLFQAFKQPIILRPMMWFFLAHVMVPNISTTIFYYQTDFLHLDPSFLGTARVVGWAGLLIGSLAYNNYLKHVKLRRILMLAQVSLAVLSLIDVASVLRLNLLIGISDKTMVLFGSALADAINQLKLMPFLIISGRLCPPGIEGTLFALFMSINNLGTTLSSFFGAGLASALHISVTSFDNLVLAIYVKIVCTLLPLGLLFLIPEEATGLSS